MGLFSNVFPDLSAAVERVKQQRQRTEEMAVNRWTQDVGVPQLHYTPQQLVSEFTREGLTPPHLTWLELLATLAPRLALQRAMADQIRRKDNLSQCQHQYSLNQPLLSHPPNRERSKDRTKERQK
jgi:hypothetical protein